MNFKNEKGITIIILIVTVIMMLILISVSTYTGINSYKSAATTKFIMQMKLVQKKVDFICEEYKGDELLEYIQTIGKGNTDPGFPEDNIKKIMIDDNYTEIQYNTDLSYIRYFDKEDLSILDLENVDDNIVINFANSRVYSLKGIKYNDIIYYNQYFLPGGQKINEGTEVLPNELTFEYTVETIGLNGKITINNKSFESGKIWYKLRNTENPSSEYWNKTDENIININKSGDYILKLSDNSGNFSEEEETNIMLYNYPDFKNYSLDNVYINQSTVYDVAETEKYPYSYSKNQSGNFESSKFGYGVEGENYSYPKVWIPRFCYKEIDGNNVIKFLKGTTNIATDGLSIDETWTIPSIFDENSKKNGVWEETTEETTPDNLNLITITADQEENYPTLVNTLIASGQYKGAYVNYVDANGNPYKDSNGANILWRVLIIDTDSNQDQFVKLVTAGTSFTAYHGATTSTTVSMLTNTKAANFNTTLASYKNSQVCDKVISILSSDIFKYYGVSSINLDTTLALDNILTINSAFLTGTNTDAYYMNYINASNAFKKGTDITIGVRPTAYLKSNVLATGGDGTINNPYTINWQAESPEIPEPGQGFDTLVNTLTALGQYKGVYVKYVDGDGYRYKDSYDHSISWRALVIDTDSNQQQFVKLISAGIPFTAYHGATTSTTVSMLTNTTAANFSTTLASYKNSQLCDKVISILSSDIFKYYGVSSINLDTTLALDNILTINSAFLTGTSNGAYYMNHINSSNVYKKGLDFTAGVRPVAYLKPNVVVTGGDGSKNNPFTIKAGD